VAFIPQATLACLQALLRAMRLRIREVAVARAVITAQGTPVWPLQQIAVMPISTQEAVVQVVITLLEKAVFQIKPL